MASVSSTTPVSNEERRWVVIGVCLIKVLTPALRNVLATEIPKWHQVLCQPPTKIDKQVLGGHQKKLHPSTLNLNYKSINNNDAIGSPRAFDYAVKDPLSLAKLFVKPFMSKFTGFDVTMDISAVLSVICEAAPFVGAAAHAKTVRSDIRNEWAHCNYAEWTEPKIFDTFQNMETLLKNVNLPPNDEQKLCDELNSWKIKGLQLCFGQPVDNEILTLLRSEVDELLEVVQKWSSEKKQCETHGNESCWNEVRILAKKFERAIPFCIAAVPNFTDSDKQSVVVNVYLHTRGVAISAKFRELAKKMFCNYELKFVDLEHEELGDYFMPRSSESKRNFEEMTNIAQIIEENFPYFVNRSNVTAVYPSYKISNHQETDDLCIAVSVVGKGKIPVGEDVLPDWLGDYPLDVVQGYVVPTCRVEYGLRCGVGIGVRGMAGTGTLGAFLTDGHDYYLLSCNHVLFKQDRALTAEQTLADEKADGKNSGEEKPAETGESECVANDQTAESDLKEEKILKNCISATEKKLEELDIETGEIRNSEKKVNTLRAAELKFRNAISDARKHLENTTGRIKSEGKILIEHPATDENNFGEESAGEKNSGAKKPAETGILESDDVADGQTAESDPVEEQRLNNYTSNNANSKIENEKVRKIKSHVRVPKEGEILIEHPTKEDVIAEVSECEKKIKSRQDILEKSRGEKNNVIRRMKSEIETEKFRLVELLDDQLPRCIARYVGGYLDNFPHKGHDIFVDAGIAKLCDDQRDEILAGNRKPYPKRTITGEVVPWLEIRKEPDGAKFWKSGAKTRLTEEGEFRTLAFNCKLPNFCEECTRNMRCDRYTREDPPETCLCKKCQRQITQNETKHGIFAKNCFLVKSKLQWHREPQKKSFFSENGDSGAVIFDEENRAWGIIVAVYFMGDSCFSVVCSLDIALEALRKETGKPNLRLWTGVAGK